MSLAGLPPMARPAPKRTTRISGHEPEPDRVGGVEPRSSRGRISEAALEPPGRPSAQVAGDVRVVQVERKSPGPVRRQAQGGKSMEWSGHAAHPVAERDLTLIGAEEEECE